MRDSKPEHYQPEYYLDSLGIDPGRVGERAMFLLDDACRALRHLDERIEQMTTQLSDRLLRVRQTLAAGAHLNGLGELQGLALDFDLTIALREQQISHIKQLCFVLKPDAG